MKTQLKAVRLKKELMDKLAPIMKEKKAGFSEVVTQAIENYIVSENFKAGVEIGAGAWKMKDHPELKHGVNAYIRRMRKGRKF